MRVFDHIILGTGQATGTLLGGLLAGDDSIAIIEGGKIGGSCVNVGCTPTKTLVASARVAHMVRRGPEYGIHTDTLQVNFPEVMARMNAVRNGSKNGLEGWITSQEQITLLRGWGQFVGPRQIKVGDEVIEGKKIYINVGTRARVAGLKGIEDVPWLDSGRLLELEALPEHLVIMGGSYIGLEFGQVFRRFGSQVTVVEHGDRLIKREDEDVSAAVTEILTNEGINIETGVSACCVEQMPSGGIRVFEDKEGGRSFEGSHLLFGIGRTPAVSGLGLDAAGIELNDRGFIQVDDYCRTSAANVFALGDVNGHGAFTHTSVNDAEIVLDLSRGGSRKLSDRIVTYGLFIDPALGRVGLTETQAIAQGYNVLKAVRPMSKISRAKEMGETQGFAKILVDADTDLILGVSILGPGGDEIINMFTPLMNNGITYKQYRKSVLVHPTISELMPWTLDSLKEVVNS
ncbi:MAG: mercuric reductase [Rhodothermales bacterium]